MDQYLTIREVRELLWKVRDTVGSPHSAAQLQEIDDRLALFHDRGIDFKEVIENLDDGILITDARGVVQYINPAYTRNTGITEEEVLHKSIFDLMGPGKLFTGGVVATVLQSRKRVFRLSTTYKTGQPLIGYVVGTPVFAEDGSLHQIIACSRPIATLSALKEDFGGFQKEVADLHAKLGSQSVEEVSPDEIVGRYGSLRGIYRLIEDVAPTDASILITGESGAGKEVIADEFFRHSLRQHKPYVKINCASIPAQLLESELFGYEKGAFTGANSKGKMGLFEQANGGTLMLDEIGDMPMDLQVKLLRAIQSQEITRIGGTKPIQLDVRFLALTNADLKQGVERGTFRKDLYYRLRVIPVHVPPLRERLEDMDALCQSFINKFTHKYNRTFRLTPRQLEYMKLYPWPGNIRELENVMEYIIICSSGTGGIEDRVLRGILDLAEDIGAPVMAAHCESEPAILEIGPRQDIDFSQAVAAFEKQLLEQVLSTSSNLREAGRRLHIDASTISRKIKLYRIDYRNKRT